MKPANPPSNLLTTDELAAELKLHPVTVRKDRTRGNSLGIPFIRVGKSIRYRSEDVAAWLEQHRTN